MSTSYRPHARYTKHLGYWIEFAEEVKKCSPFPVIGLLIMNLLIGSKGAITKYNWFHSLHLFFVCFFSLIYTSYFISNAPCFIFLFDPLKSWSSWFILGREILHSFFFCLFLVWYCPCLYDSHLVFQLYIVCRVSISPIFFLVFLLFLIISLHHRVSTFSFSTPRPLRNHLTEPGPAWTWPWACPLPSTWSVYSHHIFFVHQSLYNPLHNRCITFPHSPTTFPNLIASCILIPAKRTTPRLAFLTTLFSLYFQFFPLILIKICLMPRFVLQAYPHASRLWI